MPIADFPRYSLTFGPSPVHHLKRLSQHLGGAQVWAKREDVSSGLAFGGNKVRKLEYIVPDVLASGADETSLVKLSAPVFTELTTRLPGDVRPHVLAAVGAAWALGVPPDLIRASLLHFCEVQAAPAVH